MRDPVLPLPVPFPGQSDCRSRSSGFTLLEVMVALTIISLGMVGVFMALSQMLISTERLRSKTLASWVATDRITELRVTGEMPKAGERNDEIDMAGATWAYTIKTSPIPDMEMRRLDVTVSYADTPEDILASVIGFIAPTPTVSPGGQGDEGGQTEGSDDIRRFGEGWEPLDPNGDYTAEEPL